MNEIFFFSKIVPCFFEENGKTQDRSVSLEAGKLVRVYNMLSIIYFIL